MGILSKAYWLGILFLGVLLFSCEKEKEKSLNDIDFPPMDKGKIEVNKMFLILSKTNGEVLDTVHYSTLNASSIDTIMLEVNTNYKVEAHFVDKSGEDVNQYIEDHGEDYLVCYSPSNPAVLQITELSLDKNKDKLGLSTQCKASEVTNSEDANALEVRLKYQANTKDNLCSPGIELIYANFIYKIR